MTAIVEINLDNPTALPSEFFDELRNQVREHFLNT
jgi:hypothetical protein